MDSRLAQDYHRQQQARLARQREAMRLDWLGRARDAIKTVAPGYPAIRRVALFGSIVKAERFHSYSDIDVAVSCSDVEQESQFWRALEQALQHDVDVRPLVGPISQAVEQYGEFVYG